MSQEKSLYFSTTTLVDFDQLVHGQYQQTSGAKFMFHNGKILPRVSPLQSSLKILSAHSSHLAPAWNQAAHGMLKLNSIDGVEDGIDLMAQVVDIGKSSPSEMFFSQ